MPKMELTRDGQSVFSGDVDDATAAKLLASAEKHAAGSYSAVEYPKWVDTPKGPSYVASKAEGDELHKTKDAEDFTPLQPVMAGGTSAYVSPTYVGDGYGYVGNERVSDDRHHEVDAVDHGGAPATGPMRTVLQAQATDVVQVVGGDPAQAVKDKAQANKDALAAGDTPDADAAMTPDVVGGPAQGETTPVAQPDPETSATLPTGQTPAQAPEAPPVEAAPEQPNGQADKA